jgi:hypothetical protein
MIFRGGEFSTGEMGIFHPALTHRATRASYSLRTSPLPIPKGAGQWRLVPAPACSNGQRYRLWWYRLASFPDRTCVVAY